MAELLLKAEDLSTGYARGSGVRSGVRSGSGSRSGSGREKIVSKNLDLRIYRAEVVALIGPNGSGKSTLLRSVCGMQRPLGGALSLFGRPIEKYTARELSRIISVVLTGRYQPGHLTAERLVSLGRHPHTNFFGRITDRDLEVVEWALQSSGAADYRQRSVDELSDGELQKVMIARALAQEPALILLDEPAAFLDISRKYELMHLLHGIARDNSTAVLVTSHDLDLVLEVADRVWLMTEQGDVYEGGPGNGAFLELIRETFRLPAFFFSQDRIRPLNGT